MKSEPTLIEPTPGARCWVALEWKLKRPEGLRPGAEGVVISVNPPHYEIEVDGKRWNVDWFDFDCGYEFTTRSGATVPESDPRARTWLLKFIAEVPRGIEKLPDYRRDERAHQIAWAKQVLARNGW